MVSFTHEQNSICSQKQLNDIVHEHTIIYRQLLFYRSRGGLSVNEKEETFASNDKSNYLQISKHDGIDTCQVVYVPP